MTILYDFRPPPPPTIHFNHNDEGPRFANSIFGDPKADALTDKLALPVKRWTYHCREIIDDAIMTFFYNWIVNLYQRSFNKGDLSFKTKENMFCTFKQMTELILNKNISVQPSLFYFLILQLFVIKTL